jgi:hypothetical protein
MIFRSLSESKPLPESVRCAFCDGDDTYLVNPFGGQLSVAQYWCRRCRTAFEYIKWEDEAADQRTEGGNE